MPIISGGGGTTAGAGAITQLFDSTLGASAASFDINNIAQTYNHLLLILKLRDDGAVAGSAGNLRFNGDSGANYDLNIMLASAAVLSAGPTAGATAYGVLRATGANATASDFGSNVLDIVDYAGSGHKTINHIGGAVGTEGTTSTFVHTSGFGVWRNTAAIARITVTPGDGTNWVAGARATLYGLS